MRTAVAHAFVRMAPRVLRAVRRLTEPEGQSARNRADCGNCRGQADGGVDTSLSSTAAHAH